ncbi:MAG: glycosyltransferase [Bacteroidetes bacterium]|nr:glycosyltransferase [Bacteroidota bacterium]MCW5896246.1 glycosyltransferase [Bacteroidota bacterium]
MKTPKISIVTPSFNQGQFLESTITSILDQGYPNLEYLIIDGGSTDNSVEIIKKYQKHLAYWVSEKDRGQTDAINKGLRRITGDIWGYLCSDDTYNPGTFERCMREFKTSDADVLYGNCNFVNAEGTITRKKHPPAFTRERLLKGNFLYQPSMFLRRSVLDRFGLFDEALHYSMDYEYWVRISTEVKFAYVDYPFSNYRLHRQSKSMHAVIGMNKEGRQIMKKHGVGIMADFRYYRFNMFGKHYYAFKRRLFDYLAGS